MSGLARDLRHAFRSLARTPGFSLAAILILALGIGANVAIFSVARAVLLRPLPFRAPASLAWVWATRVDRDRAFYSIPNFLDTRAAARGFEELAAFTPWAPTLTGVEEPERLTAVRVTGNAFGLLGAKAALGRALAPEDAESRVAVIADGLWARRFGSDAGAVGHEQRVHEERDDDEERGHHAEGDVLVAQGARRGGDRGRPREFSGGGRAGRGRARSRGHASGASP